MLRHPRNLVLIEHMHCQSLIRESTLYWYESFCYTLRTFLCHPTHTNVCAKNTAIKSKPAIVPILKAEELEEQLTFASQSFVREHLTLDTDKKTVTLPKICEV